MKPISKNPISKALLKKELQFFFVHTVNTVNTVATVESELNSHNKYENRTHWLKYILQRKFGESYTLKHKVFVKTVRKNKALQKTKGIIIISFEKYSTGSIETERYEMYMRELNIKVRSEYQRIQQVTLSWERSFNFFY